MTQPWQWDEPVWRGHVNRVRAGRRLAPDGWPGGARVAVAISFDADHETISLRDNDISPGKLAQGEYGSRAGSRAMLDDGFLDRFPRYDVALGQHVISGPAGHLWVRPGVFMAAGDSLRVTVFGRGGHAPAPQATVDPIVIAASIVLRLQTIVSRELAATDVAVVTVAAIRAGAKET